MHDDEYPDVTVKTPTDERIDLMQRIVGLEQAECQAAARSKEAHAKLDAIRAERRSAVEALTKALQQTGVLPTTGSDKAVSA